MIPYTSHQNSTVVNLGNDLNRADEQSMLAKPTKYCAKPTKYFVKPN